MKKLTASKLNEIVGYPVKVNKGVFTVAKPYFYRTSSLGQFRERLSEKLQAANLEVKFLDAGNVSKPFKGGANVWNQSHYFIKVEIL